MSDVQTQSAQSANVSTSSTWPCPHCGAKQKKRHADSCKRASGIAHYTRGKVKVSPPPHARAPDPVALPSVTPVTQKVSDKISPAAPAPAETKDLKLVNQIVFILDRSGSMASIIGTAIEVFNKQLGAVKAEAHANREKQETYLSLYTFDGLVEKRSFASHFMGVKELTRESFRPGGSTALFEAANMAIQDLERDVATIKEERSSILLVIVTDGEENASRAGAVGDFARNLKRLQATDRWTFTFSVPRGGRQRLEQYGVPSGNIQEWDQTDIGTRSMGDSVVQGMSSYYDNRSKGVRSVQNFFIDMTAVSKKDLKKCDNLDGQFHKWTIDKEMEITDFVNERLAGAPTIAQRAGGATYQIGRAFYQITKPEKVQDHKQIVIRDNTTKALYGGQEARDILGIPHGVDIRLRPSDVGKFAIFVQSTSPNRKLVRGTELLYKLG